MSDNTTGDGPTPHPSLRDELLTTVRAQLVRVQAGRAVLRTNVERMRRRHKRGLPMVRVIRINVGELHRDTRRILSSWQPFIENIERDQIELDPLRAHYRKLAVRAAAERQVVERAAQIMFPGAFLLFFLSYFVVMAKVFHIEFMEAGFAVLLVCFAVLLNALNTASSLFGKGREK